MLQRCTGAKTLGTFSPKAPRTLGRTLARDKQQAVKNLGCQGLGSAQTIPALSLRRHVPSQHNLHWCDISLQPDREQRQKALEGGQSRASSRPLRSDSGLLTLLRAEAGRQGPPGMPRL